MPINGSGFEIHIVRRVEQTRQVGKSTRRRTVGVYAVFVDGAPQGGLSGAIAEQKGPSDNTSVGSKLDLRIAPGRYPLFTQDGTKYKTIHYDKSAAAAANFAKKPRPGIELKGTGTRTEILIHPAQSFLSSEGCIHPSNALATGASNIIHADSRPRVIALIEAMRAFCGNAFPAADGLRIPDCWCVVDD